MDDSANQNPPNIENHTLAAIAAAVDRSRASTGVQTKATVGWRHQDREKSQQLANIPKQEPNMTTLAETEMRIAMPSEVVPSTKTGFVVLSRFIVANGMSAEVKAAFCARPHLVDDAPGYSRMEVISPLERPEEIWLLTFWTDEHSFQTWHHSHQYHESHRGMPKGIKLVAGETSISHFEHVSS